MAIISSSWLKLPSKVSQPPPPRRSYRTLSCSSVKDILNLCKSETEEVLSPRSASILNCIKMSTTLLMRLWTVRQCRQSKGLQVPHGEHRVVIYCTSLRVVRRTFEDCRTVRSILGGFKVPLVKRDLSMDYKFAKELETIMGSKELCLPMVFVDGEYIGGAKEVRDLDESGELETMLARLPVVESKSCDVCGGLRFTLCLTCDGSHKLYRQKEGFCPCMDCNVNGLIPCPSCSTVG